MEGPTPVSALIHAATMVAAGVYIVARSHLIFAQAPLALAVVAGVGCLTAFYAATIGLVQTDIKRILAYSTISQLGYMFLGLGVGAFSAAVFHLMTHAFFKALLFLAAGSVIHALSGQQDIRRMGDLRDRVPTTYWTFFVGALAIAGIPGFAGFFSKDGILWQTFAGGHLVLWPLGLLSTGLTSFYIFRLIFLTFHGQPRYTPETARHIHESPPSMTGPLVALALLSLAGGWVGLPAPLAEKLGAKNYLENFLRPVFERSTTLLSAGAPVHTHPEELALMAVTVLVAAIGIGVAYTFYLLNPQLANGLAETFHRPYRVLLNKYYVDELYQFLLIRPLHWLSDRVLWQVVDVAVIDGAAHGTAARSQALGQWVRRLQSGNTRSYAAWVVLGAEQLSKPVGRPT
jgi:NADH-quinone oxidoreductase subunit L